MNGIKIFKRWYYCLASAFVFILFWFVLFDLHPYDVNEGYFVLADLIGFTALFISMIFKKFRGWITIVVLAVFAVSILVLIYENNIVMAYVFHSIAFSVISSDAVYSQSSIKTKGFMFLIVLILYSGGFYLVKEILDNRFTRKDVIKEYLENSFKKQSVPDKTDYDTIKNKSTISYDTSTAKNKANENNPSYDIDKLIAQHTIRSEAENFISDWKTAWTSRNFRKYKSCYTEDLIYTDKDGKKTLFPERMKQAERNFKNLSYINLDINDITYEYDDEYPNEITVKFYQTYSSNTYNDYGLKTLMLYKGKSTKYKLKIYREKFEEINKRKQDDNTLSQKSASMFKKVCLGSAALILIAILIAVIRKIFK